MREIEKHIVFVMYLMNPLCLKQLVDRVRDSRFDVKPSTDHVRLKDASLGGGLCEIIIIPCADVTRV